MRAHRHWLALLVLLLAASSPVFAQVGEKKKDEPKKEAEKITADTKIAGKNLSEWIEMVPKKDRSESEFAILKILQYPPDVAAAAVPMLIGELKKHTLANPIDMNVRVNGVMALGQLLATAKSVKDPRDPGRDLIKEGVEQLQRMVADKQVMVRYRAAQALALMGPMAKNAIPALCTMADDKETWEARYQAILALGPVGWDAQAGPTQKVITTLYGAVLMRNEPAARVRLAALTTMDNLHVGNFDKQKYRARLEEVCVEDTNPICRLHANLNVWPYLTDENKKPIALARKKHLDALEKFLASPEPEVRLELIHRLAALAPDKDKKGEPQNQLVGILYKALDDKLPGVRVEALQALAHLEMGKFDRVNYLAVLDQVAKKDPDPLVRVNAYSWIFPLLKMKTAGEKQAYGKALGGMLSSSEPAVKVEVCKLIGEIGEEVSVTVPDLIKCLGDKDNEVKHWSIFALGNMEKAGKPALPLLEQLAGTITEPAEIRETAQDAINIITGKEKLHKLKKEDKR